MPATFNPTLASAIDRIRQRIGDTDVAKAQVQDETITAYLTAGKTELQAARQLCLDLAAKWARFGTTTLDDQQQRSEDVYKHYLAMAEEILKEINLSSAGPGSTGSVIVGGLNDTRGPLQDWPLSSYPTPSWP